MNNLLNTYIPVKLRSPHCEQDKGLAKYNKPHISVYCAECGLYVYHMPKTEYNGYLRLRSMKLV